MNIKRAVLIALVVIAALIALVAVGVLPNPLKTQSPEAQVREITAYASPEHRLAFAYPESFELREIPLVNGENKWSAITLADKEILRQAEEHGASEGPPLIAFQIFPNPTNMSAEEWVKTSQLSNFTLSVNGVIATTTVAGQPAVAYRYSGLYTSDVVVVSHNNKIYMFLVDWLTEDDQNIKDFDNILASLQFI